MWLFWELNERINVNRVLQRVKIQRGETKPHIACSLKRQANSNTKGHMFPGTDKFLFTVLIETVTLIMSVVFRVPLVMSGSTDWILQLDFGCSKMTMARLPG